MDYLTVFFYSFIFYYATAYAKVFDNIRKYENKMLNRGNFFFFIVIDNGFR